MGIYTRVPTATATPAPGVFGSGTVTNQTATGHDASTVQTSPGNADVGMSAEWSSFQAFPAQCLYQIRQMTLKATWSIDGSLNGAGASNQYEIDYSVNGGSSWTASVVRTNVVAPDSGTIAITLSPTQDISQVEIRDVFLCGVVDTGTESASGTMTISDIRLELVTDDDDGGMM